MIEVIRDYLNTSKDDLNNEDKADYILCCCEMWGMLPPSAKLGFLNTEDNAWEAE
jgi:hypothetical protein